MSSWTQGLNPEQAQAVQHNHGPLLILAGAGSGKTTVLVSRTGRLIADGIAAPSEICVLTFTNKAARELKSRVAKKVGDQAKGLWAGTFHSFGLQLLKKNYKAAGLPQQFAVIDHSDSQGLIKEIAKDVRINTKDKFDTEKILNLINHLRVHGRFSEQAFDEYHEMAEILTPKYVRKMELLGCVDFEGLLIKPLELFHKYPEVLEKTQTQIQQMMVDEFQDTNEIQMQLIDKIVSRHKNLSVVGDDDQSIYGWRGAQVSNILDFPKRYQPCQVVKLERNYRSTPAIIELANDVIGKNKKRHGKVLKAETRASKSNKPELFLFENEEAEAEFIGREVLSLIKDKGVAPSSIAVLYRSNTQSGMVESIMRRQQIPYDVSGGTAFFDRKEVKDVLAYLRLSIALNDVPLRRIINTPARGLGDTSIEKIIEYSTKTGFSFYKSAQQWREAGLPEKAGASIDQLFQFLKDLPEKIIRDPSTQLPQVFRELGYRDYLLSLSKDAQGADKKWILIEVLSNILASFVRKGGPTVQTLKEFVESMELRDDQKDDEETPKVQLMTLHACKGLEFPVVFLIGVEEDLLPHKNLGSDIDEERRLFYVGITRAEEKLMLTRCKSRMRNGTRKPVTMSRFLLESDKNLLIDHKGEFRPVTADEREDLVKNFLANLGKR